MCVVQKLKKIVYQKRNLPLVIQQNYVVVKMCNKNHLLNIYKCYFYINCYHIIYIYNYDKHI